jgi:hypothetical protein
MADARTILDERLAKGEISKEEYASLLATISTDAPIPLAPAKKGSPPNLLLGMAALCLAIFMVFYANTQLDHSLPGMGNAVAFWYVLAAICAVLGVVQFIDTRRAE